MIKYIRCMCGCLKEDHLYLNGRKELPFCNECCLKGVQGATDWRNYHEFTPDNLTYIEDLAKTKGLV